MTPGAVLALVRRRGVLVERSGPKDDKNFSEEPLDAEWRRAKLRARPEESAEGGPSGS